MAKSKELKRVAVNKLGEIIISRWGIVVGNSDIDNLLKDLIGCRNIKDGKEVKFNGKVTIIIEELADSRDECNFTIEKEENEEEVG